MSSLTVRRTGPLTLASSRGTVITSRTCARRGAGPTTSTLPGVTAIPPKTANPESARTLTRGTTGTVRRATFSRVSVIARGSTACARTSTCLAISTSPGVSCTVYTESMVLSGMAT